MDLADGVLWPLATGPDAFAATIVALAQRRYDAIGARPETLGAPPRRCALVDPLGRLSGPRSIA